MMHPTLVELDALIPELYGENQEVRLRASRRRDELLTSFADSWPVPRRLPKRR